MATDFYPDGLHAEFPLQESKTNAMLQVRIQILGCDELGMENAAVMMTGEDGQLQTGVAQTVMAVEGGGMGMASGEQTLLVNVMNARGLYNADGFLAGKSDPYCICMIPEKPDCKFQTSVIPNCLDPEWNHPGRIEGFQAGDSLEFQVWDSDTFPKPDQLLGKVVLTAEDFAANSGSLMGVLQLTGGLSGDEHGTLEICVQAASGVSANVMVTSSTGPAPGTVVMTSPTTTYSAPGVPSQPCYAGSQAAYSSYPTMQALTYAAPQAASASLVGQPTMTYSASGALCQANQAGSMTMMGQPLLTYSSPGAQTGVQTGKVLQVIVHPPKNVTAQEFAQCNGTIVSTPLPVTSAGTGIVETVERTFKNVKIKKTKKKSKSCC